MKNLVFILSLIAIIGTSCSKTSQRLIVGYWTLSKTCISDGSSSCDHIANSPPFIVHRLNFNDEGIFTILFRGETCSGNYTLNDTEGLTLSYDSQESNPVCFLGVNPKIFLLTRDSLQLNDFCFEPCGRLYIRD